MSSPSFHYREQNAPSSKSYIKAAVNVVDYNWLESTYHLRLNESAVGYLCKICNFSKRPHQNVPRLDTPGSRHNAKRHFSLIPSSPWHFLRHPEPAGMPCALHQVQGFQENLLTPHTLPSPPLILWMGHRLQLRLCWRHINIYFRFLHPRYIRHTPRVAFIMLSLCPILVRRIISTTSKQIESHS